MFDNEGASLIIHPEICRQRLALVKMLWGLLLCVVWNQFKSRFLGKLWLFAFLQLCPGRLAGPDLAVHFNYLDWFQKVQPGRPERFWQLRARAAALALATQAQA